MSDDEDKCIVIDGGACNYLAGFAGDDAPRCYIRCVTGRRPGSSDVLYGDEAFKKRTELDIASPIQRGLVTNWDDMEKVRSARKGACPLVVWSHVFILSGTGRKYQIYKLDLRILCTVPGGHR